MRFEDLNWMDMQTYLERDDRVMLVLGACEQHGYLSLATDIRIPFAIADAASALAGVPVAPAMPFGISPYFLSYPGTISLRPQTLLQVVRDVVESLYGQGFRGFLILNGHGGNAPAQAELYQLCNERADLRLQWFTWWTSEHVAKITEKHGFKIFHGGAGEAFRFTRVADLSQGEKTPVVSLGLLSANEVRERLGDGVFGGPYQIEDHALQEVFDIAVTEVVHLLDDLKG